MTGQTVVVAIDGPAGSGKSSVSRAIARRRFYGYLDTGAAYRAMAWLGISRGINPDDPDQVESLCASFSYRQETDPEHFRAWVAQTDVTAAIRTPEVSGRVSAYSAVPRVRAELIARFRALIAAETRDGIVVEGRDITTVVAPDATVRVLLTASPEARARRRAGQRGDAEVARVAAALAARDAKDSSVTSFLTAAPGVTVLDTSDLNFEQSVTALDALIEQTIRSTEEIA